MTRDDNRVHLWRLAHQIEIVGILLDAARRHRCDLPVRLFFETEASSASLAMSINARVLAGGAMLPGYAACMNICRVFQLDRSRTSRPAATSARKSTVHGKADRPAPSATRRITASLLAAETDPRSFTRTLRPPRSNSIDQGLESKDSAIHSCCERSAGFVGVWC